MLSVSLRKTDSEAEILGAAQLLFLTWRSLNFTTLLSQATYLLTSLLGCWDLWTGMVLGGKEKKIMECFYQE